MNQVKTLFIFAHPDDEILGASTLINRQKEKAEILFVTNGMPLPKGDPQYYPPFCAAPEYGADYIKMRKNEAHKALNLFGIHKDKIHFLDFDDMETISRISKIIIEISRYIQRLLPETVVTHAYEGGHIDHDIICFAVNQVLQKICNQIKINLIEVFLYNFENNQYNHNSPLKDYPFQGNKLSPEEINLKENALTQYASQKDDLQYFDSRTDEHFIPWENIPTLQRFLYPPHQGSLQYEKYFSFADFLNAIKFCY